MRHAIYSDIHGNLEALSAILKVAESRAVDTYICLGDIVGYGASPNECVDIVRKLSPDTTVMGNHDAATIDERERSFFHEVALDGIKFTEGEINDDNREFLARLPYEYRTNVSFLCVHASPYRPSSWEYVLDQRGAERAFNAMDRSVAFIGHSHAPAVFTETGVGQRFQENEPLKVHSNVRYVINVGSVGQPRDGNPDASFVIFDDTDLVAKLYRVKYDTEKSAEKILKAGLPPVLAERLLVGY